MTPDPPSPGGAAAPPAGPLVLIVDDDERNRKLAQDILRRSGLRTIEAASGRAAIALARDCVPDVVLLDLRACGRSDKDFVDVSIAAMGADVARLCEHLGLQRPVVNGWSLGGAVAVEAVARLSSAAGGLVLTGGNIDVRLLASTLLRGLARDGRLVALSVSVPDAVGSLSAITTSIAASGGNIVEIRHDRLFARESARRATVELVVEAQDREHVAAIVRALAAAGFPVAENPIHKQAAAAKSTASGGA